MAKTRLGFVSNSSSSSFIVIADTGALSNTDSYKDQSLVVDEYIGKSEFGWEYERSNDFGSKVIFAYLQTHYTSANDWLDMLESVIKEHTGASEIVWMFGRDENGLCNAYIDHQSCSGEGNNTEMFDNKESLKNFLFNDQSYIQTDNDNH